MDNNERQPSEETPEMRQRRETAEEIVRQSQIDYLKDAERIGDSIFKPGSR